MSFLKGFKIELIKDYKFNKWIFRIGLLLILIFYGSIMYFNNFDFKGHIYVSCPNNSISSCENPYYNKCNDFYCDSSCKQFCNDKTIMAGVSYGSQPKSYITVFILVSTAIIILCFIINHIYYNKGKKPIREIISRIRRMEIGEDEEAKKREAELDAIEKKYEQPIEPIPIIEQKVIKQKKFRRRRKKKKEVKQDEPDKDNINNSKGGRSNKGTLHRKPEDKGIEQDFVQQDVSAENTV